MLIGGFQSTTLLDYPGHLACTVFTQGCNFRCPFCQNGSLVLPEKFEAPFSEEDVLARIRKRTGIYEGVCVSGGEPTNQPDLAEFLKKIKDMGLLVKLDSNGTNPGMVKELVREQLVDYIAMDIKHSKEKYNTIASMAHFDINPIEETVEFLKEGNVDYEFRTTIMRECHEASDIESIGKWLQGGKAYYLQSYRESEQVINPVFSPHSTETLQEFVEILRPYIPNTHLRGID